MTMKSCVSFLVAMLLCLGIISCKPTPKSPIEIRFEQYVRANNLTDDVISIDSIVQIDSVHIIGELDKLKIESDSLNNYILDRTNVLLNKSKIHKYNLSIAIEAAEIVVNHIDRSDDRKEKLQKLQDRIITLLDDKEEEDCYYTTHKIYVNTKSGKDSYIALTIGYQDTTIIDTKYKGGYTLKSKRVEECFSEYYSEAIAAQLVTIDKMNAFISKYNLE